MVFFCFKEISPIKVEVSRIIFEELEAEKEIETQLLNFYDQKKMRQTKSEKSEKSKGKNKNKDKILP